MTNILRLAVMAVVIAFCARSGRAIERGDILFHADFENGADAVISGPDGKAKTDGQIEKAPGRVGQCIVLDRGACIRWPQAGNLLRRQGTIEFWFKLQGRGREGNLLEIGGKNGARITHSSVQVTQSGLFYDTGKPIEMPSEDPIIRMLFSTPDPMCAKMGWGFYTLEHKLKKENAGAWHHAVFAWQDNKNETSFWVDGQKTVTWGVFASVLDTNDFGLGKTGCPVAIDEVFVYRRPLSAGEIISAWHRPENLKKGTGLALFAPMPKTPPIIDGKLTEGDWDLCSSAVIGMLSGLTGELASRQMMVQVCHKDGKLYLSAADVPDLFGKYGSGAGDSLTIIGKGKEWVIGVDGKIQKGEGGKIASSFETGQWVLEAELPLEMFGYQKGSPIRFDVKRHYANQSEETMLCGAEGAQLVLLETPYPGIRVMDLGRLPEGSFKPKVAITSRSGSSTLVKIQTNPDDNSTTSSKTSGTPAYEQGNYKSLYWPQRVYEPELALDENNCQVIKMEAKVEGGGNFVQEVPYSFRKLPVITALDCGLDQETMIYCYIGNLPKGFLVQADILPMDADKALHSLNLDLARDGYTADKIIATADLPVGEYRVRARILSPKGNLIAENEAFLRKWTKYNWKTVKHLGDNEGTVMAPWTPIKTEKNKAECWGRTYVFGDNGLPEQMISQGLEMLAGPITVEAVVNGNALPAGKLKEISNAPDKLVVEGSLGDADNKVIVRSKMEYDGFLWVEIDPGGAVNGLDKLTVDIPLKDDLVPFRHYDDEDYRPKPGVDARFAYTQGYDRRGETPKGNGVVLERSWTPFMYLGCDKVGFQFLAENDRGWEPVENGKSVALIRQDKTLHLRLTLVAEKTPKEHLDNISFSLQATPTRPLPKFRQMKLDKNIGNMWMAAHADLWSGEYPGTAAPGSYIFRNDGHYRSFQAMSLREKVAMCPYNTSYEVSAIMWDVRKHYLDWMVAPGSFAIGGPFPYCAAMPRCCRQSDYPFLKLAEFAHYFDEINGEWMYLDDSHTIGCANSAHGCGWTDYKGLMHKNFPFIAQRNFAKRLHKMFLDRGKEPKVVWHMYHLVPAVVAFGGWITQGENLCPLYASQKTWDIEAICSKEGLRAQYTSQPRGVVDLFLCEPCNSVPYDWKKDPKGWGERNLAYLIVHDIALWAQYVPPKIVEKIFAAWDTFGMGEDDVAFIPYWDTQEAFRLVSGDAYASAYKRPGRVLFVIDSRPESPQDVAVSFDAKKLGLAGQLTARDLMTGETVTLDKDAFKVKFEKCGFRAVLVQVK